MTVAKRRKLSNPLALAVMATLGERPMHPYELARVLRQRGKDQSVKINYGSLYTVVQNLEKHGYVEVTGVQRQGNRPERTLYGLTGDGRAELHDWLADLLLVPAREYPLFEAALSLAMVLAPDEVAELLTERVNQLEVKIAGIRGMLAKLRDDLPRLFLIETEYQAHMIGAEVEWIRGFLKELRAGSISGAAEWRAWHETGEIPEEWAGIDDRSQDSGGHGALQGGDTPTPNP